jgi:3D (Asp-Asp-Asp) domain-containing protein
MFINLINMRLQVNLIPALAYALVMMFSNMAGMTGTAAKSAQKQQAVLLSAPYPEVIRQENCVYIAQNGQVILSNGSGKGNLEWKIPYLPETKMATASL